MNDVTPSRRLLFALDEAVARLEQVEREKTEPIAIIGMSCRFPGHVHDLASYWRLLSEGRDAIAEVPASRWSNDAWYDPDPEAPARMVTRFGGFLDDVEQFDYRFFGMSPREAASLDPQHRLVLEVGWEALENAGQVREQLLGSATGVFVGITTNDYARIITQRTPLADVDGYFHTGNALNAAAGRLSYFLGLQGSSLAVDTACSSSLVAVHLACLSLRARECTMAVAGGVNVILAPEISVAISQGRMLSPDGHCKTFDADADGYGRGEGCGIVVLKRQSDALAAGDPIVAVIRGSAVNQDGASGGFTIPSGSAQQMLIRRALANARLTPAQIDYVEAHGTGTALGDPIEMNALGEVLKEGRPPDRPVFVGSVKANLGHLESAAGAAGLIKVALALEHGAIPPHRPVRRPNPHIAWQQLPVRLPTQLIPWDSGGAPRRAAVSSFGASGTNAHLVLEQAPVSRVKPREHERPLHVLALSARSPEALRESAARYRARLDASDAPGFPDVCYSANTGRTHFNQRLAVVAGGTTDAVQAIDAWLSGHHSPHIVVGDVKSGGHRALGLYLADCAHPPKIARELYDQQHVFRQSIDRCADAARLCGVSDLHTHILSPTGSEPTVPERARRCTSFAVHVGLVELLHDWGIRPVVVRADSCAEYAAACVAGILSLEESLRRLAAGLDVFDRDLQPDVSTSTRRLEFVRSGAPAAHVMAVPGNGDRHDEARHWTNGGAGIVTLPEQRSDITLSIGPGLAFAGSSTSEVTLNLWAPEDTTSSHWRPLLYAVSQLHVLGVQVDWRSFDRAYGRSRIPVPHYPLQRERCWIEDAPATTSVPDSSASIDTPTLALLSRGETEALSTQLAESGRFSARERELLPKLLDAIVQQHRTDMAGGAPSYRSWLYEVGWRAAPAYGRELGGALPGPAEVVAAVRAAGALAAGAAMGAYDAALEELETLSVGYARRALRTLGWAGTAGERVPLEDVGRRLGVVPRYERLLGRLLEMLAETGWLRREGRQWVVMRSWGGAEEEEEEEAAPLAAVEAEWRLLARCGGALAAVLRGERDPVGVLFPAGALHSAASLYRDAAGARLMNGLVEQAVAAVVRDWPAGRGLRVLEVGAGTGGTTASVLRALPAERTTYTFTDISPRFLAEAETRFGAWGAVRGAVLDIERSPAAQGFGEGEYDLIVAANVLHATRALGESVGHVRALLAPGGVLVLLEGTAPVRFIDVIFGLTEGWWRFADAGVRAGHPLISAAAWTGVLAAHGFAAAAALTEPDGTAGAVLARQAVIVAQAARAARAAAGRWVILADEGGVGAAVGGLLRERGAECRVVYAGPGPADGRERVAAGREALAQVLASGGGPLRGVVHLWSLDTPAADQLTPASLRAGCASSCGSALHLVQALIAGPGGDPPPRLCFVTRDAVATHPASRVNGLVQSPLWGLGRIISLEHPDLQPLCLDLDDATPAAAAGRVFEELLANDLDDQIALRGDARYVARLQRHVTRPTPPERAVEFHRQATYLITGGLGGLGVLVAEWMISRGAGNVVLVGRHGPGAETEDRLATLSEAGSRVDVMLADVSDPAALEHVVNEIRRTHPPLRGIVHAAGVLDDAMLAQQDWSRFSRVFDAKVVGTLNLLTATRDASLDFLILFSSGASLLGSAGQANHAAANAFLDACAHHQRARGAHAISINWGAWAEIGAAAVRNVDARINAAGIGAIAPRDGLQALEYLIGSPAAQVGVVPVDWRRFMADRESYSFLAEFKSAAGPPPGPAPSEILEQLRDAPAKKRRALLEAHVESHTRKVLHLARGAALDLHQGFFELGMDSLTSMELKNRLQKSLGLNLPNTLTFDHPTPDAVVAYVMEKLFSAAPAASRGGDEAASADAHTAALDGLSGDEIGDLLDAVIVDIENGDSTS